MTTDTSLTDTYLTDTSLTGGTGLAPPGLEGVAVSTTTIGDVRGREGFFHYRGYSAVELAATRSFEEVWYLVAEGSLPGTADAAAFATAAAADRVLPPGLGSLLDGLSVRARPLEVLRSAVSILGAELGWPALVDIGPEQARAEARRLCSLLPTVVATVAVRGSSGAERALVAPVGAGLPLAANYLSMLLGHTPEERAVRALEQYLVLTIDHGFNASTFAARVIASTGADLSSAICGAIGALSGPLHGGAPSRVLDMLDAIGDESAVENWVRDALAGGDRIMGFGHRIYRREDPRSRYLRELAEELGSPRLELARTVEETVVRVLDERYPERELRTNVEFYASIVLESCGIARELFTPTFAVARAVGWCANVIEQLEHNRLFRPVAHYVGPAPRPVPPRSTAA